MHATNYFTNHIFWTAVIRMSLECHLYVMSVVCPLYVLVCHPHATRVYSYVIRMSLDSHVLACHPYVARTYSYVIRMSLVCHSYIARMWFYHEPPTHSKIWNTQESFISMSSKVFPSSDTGFDCPVQSVFCPCYFQC